MKDLLAIIPLLLLQAGIPVSGQSNDDELAAFQTIIDEFCRTNKDLPGCQLRVKPSTSAEGLPPGSVAGPSSDECPAGTRKCQQLPQLCVPSTIDCGDIGTGIQCDLPSGLGVAVQSLICGSNGQVGENCDHDRDRRVDFLTEILVQCQDDSKFDQYLSKSVRPIATFGSLDESGSISESGAGIYQCTRQTNWKPLYDSPSLRSLIKSCYFSGCGMLPQPRPNQAADRPWSWVRSILENGKHICTATLITPEAALTAAHCVTKSQASKVPIDLNQYRLNIEIPFYNTTQTVRIRTIEINPEYEPGNILRNDLAIVTFKGDSRSKVPYACIVGKLPNINPPGIVFEIDGKSWRDGQATMDIVCGTDSCPNGHQPTRNEFCAMHNDIEIEEGSSGGPYLSIVGSGYSDIMGVVGVLSKKVRDCGRIHSVYTRTLPHGKWIWDCALENDCL